MLIRHLDGGMANVLVSCGTVSIRLSCCRGSTGKGTSIRAALKAKYGGFATAIWALGPLERLVRFSPESHFAAVPGLHRPADTM